MLTPDKGMTEETAEEIRTFLTTVPENEDEAPNWGAAGC